MRGLAKSSCGFIYCILFLKCDTIIYKTICCLSDIYRSKRRNLHKIWVPAHCAEFEEFDSVVNVKDLAIEVASRSLFSFSTSNRAATKIKTVLYVIVILTHERAYSWVSTQETLVTELIKSGFRISSNEYSRLCQHLSLIITRGSCAIFLRGALRTLLEALFRNNLQFYSFLMYFDV